MARRRTYTPLNVYINARLVGALRRETSGAIDFIYDQSWLDWKPAFPISLSLPLREDHYIGAPVSAVFDNLLPDSEPIRNRVAERVGAEGTDTFSLLTALGNDCVGALQFLPEHMDPGSAGSIEAKPISDAEIASIIRNLASTPLGLDAEDDFRISIAGAQEKTALHQKDGKWFKPVGTTATTHILKPKIGRLPSGIDLSNSVENEYLCLKLVSALGVPTADATIDSFDGRRVLVVKRFDRIWTSDGRLLRLPQEDCCQALSVPSTRKYQSDKGPGIQQIAELLKGSDTPEEDIRMFVRANIIFWLIGATDGHAKNFSIFLGSRGFRMTPLYDILTAQPSLDAGQIQRKQFKLAMSVGKNRHYHLSEVLPRHYFQTADRAGIGMLIVESIIDDLKANAIKKAEDVFNKLPEKFPVELIESVRKGIHDRVARLNLEGADIP